MKKRKSIPTPSHLSARSKLTWRSVVPSRVCSAECVAMLLVALEQLELAESARKQIARDGLTIESAKGEVVEHPLIKSQREAIKLFVAIWNRLELNSDPIEYAEGPPLSPFDIDGLYASISS